jgi:hypothetical protein
MVRLKFQACIRTRESQNSRTSFLHVDMQNNTIRIWNLKSLADKLVSTLHLRIWNLKSLADELDSTLHYLGILRLFMSQWERPTFSVPR